MKDVLYMAWQYLRYYRGKTLLLIAAISLVLFVPAGLHVVVENGARMLTSRAEATPLLVGAKGSAVDLTLSALYFREPNLESLEFGEVESCNSTGMAMAIPLHLRYSAGEQRIVGTSLDYTDFRNLTIARGRWFGLLGECVLGYDAAKALRVDIGEYIFSSSGSAFDVAGAFPLKMPVVGILEKSGTPDDSAVFTDVKTTWIISGLAHGHDDVTLAGDGSQTVLKREGGTVTASAALLSYTEITPENVASFHFHGDPDSFPIDAFIAVPNDRKSGVILRGRYGERIGDVQMLLPEKVIGEVMKTMFSVRDYVVLGSLAVGASTFIIVALVFALSIRLRGREIETVRRIGGSSQRLRGVLISEIIIVIATGVMVAGVMTLIVGRFGTLIVALVNTK